MLARYYGPGIGRFVSPDPIGVKGDRFLRPVFLNLYTYAESNPIKFFDPTGEDPFLAVRPLGDNPKSRYAHMFVVSNAAYLGDPAATVYSYGATDSGYLGRVGNNTQNDFSKTTHQSDIDAWLSLANPNSTASATPIPASDSAVDVAANALMENLDYAASAGLFGANSNSAAQAVANEAAGRPVAAPGPRKPHGAGSSGKIGFDKNKDGKPDKKTPKQHSQRFKDNEKEAAAAMAAVQSQRRHRR